MTSITKQLRSGTGAFSRENMEVADMPEIAEDQVSEVLADPVVAEVDGAVTQDVAAMDDGSDAIVEASDDADTLENTAQILEDAISADGEEVAPADVEPAAAEIADVAVESISRKYGMARNARISKENFDSAAARIATYRALSSEAFEKATELKNRALEGIKKLITWFKNLIKSIFDKRVRMENKISALTATVAALKEEPKAGAKIKIGGWGAVVGDAVSTDVLAGVKEMVPFTNGLSDVAAIVSKNVAQTADVAEVDLNPKKLAGLTLKFSATAGKYSVTKEQTGKPDAVEISALSKAEMTAALKAAFAGLKALKEKEKFFDVLTKDLEGGIGKLKALVTGKEGDDAAERGAIMARYQTVTKLSSTISSVSLSVIGSVINAVEASVNAKEA